jgi:hypothetical protein
MSLSVTEDSFSTREHKIPNGVLYISEKVYTKIFMATDEFLSFMQKHKNVTRYFLLFSSNIHVKVHTV